MSSDHTHHSRAAPVEVAHSPQLNSIDQHKATKVKGSKDTDDLPQQHEHVAPSSLARSNSASEVPAPGAVPLTPDVPQPKDTHDMTTLLAGTKLEPFHVDTTALVNVSPYFSSLAMFNDESTQHSSADLISDAKKRETNPLAGPFSFPEFDEYAVALLTRWLHDPNNLPGPHDFHSLNHYLCLYALAQRFGIERLKNQVMDLVRHYYHAERMTAPPFRLEYIYSSTSSPNPMREFLVTTAAYRVLSKGLPESENVGYTFKQTEPVSDSLHSVLRGGGDVAPDFVDKLVFLTKHDMDDPRKGNDCQWHEHTEGEFGTVKCRAWEGFEAYESH